MGIGVKRYSTLLTNGNQLNKHEVKVVQVREFSAPNGEYNQDKLLEHVPKDVARKIVVSIPLSLTPSPDELYWALTSSAGCAVSDSDGHWLRGFTVKLDSYSAYQAKLWQYIYQSLKLAWELGLRRIWLQVDNRMVVNAVTTPSSRPYANSDLLQVIRTFLQRQWEVKILHIYQEGNMIADHMAN
ncbi:Uncharacterized protein TCM_019113 [Theobroma cacao]|uniref:RNase H type-1 domain-containing protein n=1 Tax=Theobroma cacao TaxID=3641 RepID=A0A061EFU7_THECC|nr:Uncharacterized protein TCM_019113 [Theobroma cacao]